MLVIDRKKYSVREYRECRDVDVGVIQLHILELLQSGKPVHYSRLILWIKWRTKREISVSALRQHIYRLKSLGFDIKCEKSEYYWNEKEIYMI